MFGLVDSDKLMRVNHSRWKLFLELGGCDVGRFARCLILHSVYTGERLRERELRRLVEDFGGSVVLQTPVQAAGVVDCVLCVVEGGEDGIDFEFLLEVPGHAFGVAFW
jgi:hypothetical protein